MLTLLKTLSLVIFLFSLTHIFAQVTSELIPFNRNGLWGYCDTNLVEKINPKFSDAFPFYKGIGVVHLSNKVDTLLLEDPNSNKSNPLFKSGLINIKGENVISPFFGEVKLKENYIICNYGHLELNENGAISVVDSSLVISYKGKTILPVKKGRYNAINTKCISYDSVPNYSDMTVSPQKYYYDNKLFYTVDANHPIINCNDFCCWFHKDAQLTIIDFEGNITGKFKTTESRDYPLEKNKIFHSYIDGYSLFDLQNKKIEDDVFWLINNQKLTKFLEKIKNENWRTPMLAEYKFQDFYFSIIDISSDWFKVHKEDDGSAIGKYYYLNRNNFNMKTGPYTFATEYYKGKALVKNTGEDMFCFIDNNGNLSPANLTDAEIEAFPNSDFFPQLLKISEKDKILKYYFSVDGRKYIVK